MEIIDFIKSKDIREYLRSINYQFSALEAAWVIWQSKYTAILEKHKAWKCLMDTKPDCKVILDGVLIEASLFSFLREMIALECARIEEFGCSSNAVYAYLFREPYFEGYTDSFKVFSDYETCLEEIREEQLYSFDNTRYIVRKLGVDNKMRSMEVGLTNDLSIWRVNFLEDVVEEDIIFSIDLDYYHRVFQEMKPNIPMPFKDGEVLQLFDSDFYFYGGKPFVFTKATRADKMINCLELEYYQAEQNSL